MGCRTRRRAASGRPKYKDYFTDDASLSDSAALDEEDDEEDDEDDDFLSEISMREGHYGMQSRNSSLQSADASHFKRSGGCPPCSCPEKYMSLGGYDMDYLRCKHSHAIKDMDRT